MHLRKGEQTQPAYRKINPAGLVPYWIDGDFELAQSLAIIEYLDETHPEPPLLPPDAKGRAMSREDRAGRRQRYSPHRQSSRAEPADRDGCR